MTTNSSTACCSSSRDSFGATGVATTIRAGETELIDGVKVIHDDPIWTSICPWIDVAPFALVTLAPLLREDLRPGGTLLASGIFIDREAEVRAAFVAAGLTVTARTAEGEWVALEAVRRDPRELRNRISERPELRDSRESQQRARPS